MKKHIHITMVPGALFNSEGRSWYKSCAAASNLDLYQVSSTYFEFKGKKELSCLIARAKQLFDPGFLQVYYEGLLNHKVTMNINLEK